MQITRKRYIICTTLFISHFVEHDDLFRCPCQSVIDYESPVDGVCRLMINSLSIFDAINTVVVLPGKDLLRSLPQ